MIATPQILRRYGSLLQSEVYMELTQLELMVNDSCCGPPGTHLRRIKVFLHALSSAHVSACNELGLAIWVRGEEEDLLLALRSTTASSYCRIKYSYRTFLAHCSHSQAPFQVWWCTKVDHVTSEMQDGISVPSLLQARTARVLFKKELKKILSSGDFTTC